MFLLQYRRHNKISQKNVLWHSTYVHIILVDMRKPVLEKKHYICELVPVADLSKVMEGRWISMESRIENYHREVGIYERKI